MPGATMTLLRPCTTCGEPTTNPQCPTHTTHHPKRPNRGYDTQWQRLSRTARRLQPWCTDCGTTTDLQADHSPQAWTRHHTGQPIRLQDIDVVCGPCNRARGPARPGGTTPTPTTHTPRPSPSFGISPGGAS